MPIYLLWFGDSLSGAFKSFDSALNDLLETLKSDNKDFPQDYIRAKEKIFEIIKTEGTDHFIYDDFFVIEKTYLYD